MLAGTGISQYLLELAVREPEVDWPTVKVVVETKMIVRYEVIRRMSRKAYWVQQ